MRFSVLWIPLPDVNGSHQWIRRARSYVSRACSGKCELPDVAQELALIRSERSFLVSTEPEPALPVRCQWCAAQHDRCKECRAELRTYRRAARYSARRVMWRVFKLAIRRAHRAARSSEQLSALILDEQRECRAAAAMEWARAESAALNSGQLAAQLSAQEARAAQLSELSAAERARFRVYMNEAAHRALSANHKDPMRSVVSAAHRWIKSKLSAPKLS
jgi:hypothetical protein